MLRSELAKTYVRRLLRTRAAIVAVLLATLITGSIFYQAVRLAGTMYQVLEIVAQQIGLGPVGSGT